MKLWSFLKEGKPAQKKFLGGVIAAAAMLLLYTYGVVPLVEAKKKADEEIALNQRLLQRYAEVLQGRKAAEESLERALKQNEEVEKRLLPGETPQLGAAGLQETVKGVAEKYGISLRSFRNLEPKETGWYRRISLQIDFNPIGSIQSLSQFIYEIEHQPKQLMITEMDLLVFNPRMPNNIQGSMVISGVMKGGKPKEAKETSEKGRRK